MKSFCGIYILIVLGIQPQQSTARGRGGGGFGGGGFRGGGGGGTHISPPLIGLASRGPGADCKPKILVEVITGVDVEECKKIPAGPRRVEGIGHCRPQPRKQSPPGFSSDLNANVNVDGDVIADESSMANLFNETQSQSQNQSLVRNSSAPVEFRGQQEEEDKVVMDIEKQTAPGNNETTEMTMMTTMMPMMEVVFECVCEWTIDCGGEKNGGRTSHESQEGRFIIIVGLFTSILFLFNVLGDVV